MKIKVIAIILAIIFIILMITGCTQFKKNSEFWNQYNDGFATKYGKTTTLDRPIIAAVGGRQKEYDLDDVTLDFIYGGEPLSNVAIYVSAEDYYVLDFINVSLDDYKNISGIYFINEKTQTEFACGPFDIEVSWAYDLYYHFVDTWTVPKEVFNKEKGRFIFWATYLIGELNETGELKYRLLPGNDAAKIYVYYEKIGDKIRLSDEWW